MTRPGYTQTWSIFIQEATKLVLLIGILSIFYIVLLILAQSVLDSVVEVFTYVCLLWREK